MEKPSERLLSSKAFSPDAKWILLLTVAAIALWLIGLGNMPLRDWDEGYYSVVARELTQTHHWLYPTRFGAPYFPKPPFGYWLGSMGYWLFGEVNEFTTRFPMAIATALGVPLLYSVVRELSPRRREAILTAGVYMTMLSVVRLGRLHMFDGYINTLLILWMLCLLKAKTSRPWAVGMGFCLAGIALSKGILAIALGGVLLAFVIADRRWSLLQNPYTWLGL
ncbi:MAG: glycosyltransferase family 39 protein, partial [Cyanobacteria bacterium J06555_13]